MFTDKVKIFIKAGDGGDGSASLHTEKYVPNGGPDGGDGGDGGSVVFTASSSVNTLNDFHYNKHFRAGSGGNGGKKNCTGKRGTDVTVTVPCGTVLKDAESGKIVADMFYDGQQVVVLCGGKGGRGNRHFATGRRQTPKFAEHGEKSLEREIILELKTIADVGLVGFPNVGKSTILAAATDAKPKIANYSFTTLSPNLGVVSYFDKTFVMADIPGLIEGASEGVGLGHDFLRHIERTRLLVHVVDISGAEGRDPVTDFRVISDEIYGYDDSLRQLPVIIAANKYDSPEAEKNFVEFEKVYGKKYTIVATSAVLHENIDLLISEIVKALVSLKEPEPLTFEPFEFDSEDKESFGVDKLENGVYEVTGGLIKELKRRVRLDDTDSLRYFQRVLKEKGVIKELRKQGAVDGDTVIVGDTEFDFIE